ncbi:MAG TPA: ABC transporter permease subunit [Planctomycetota bacterium]|nr:ABC transporter permease subunit [Planctomycetota bacterium]
MIASMLHIARREMRSFFAQPMAWIVLVLYLFLNSMILAVELEYYKRTDFALILRNNLYLLWLAMPLLTMRSISEEIRSGTLEMLLCSPLSEWSIAVGKFLGQLAFLIVMLIPTIGFIFVMLYLGATLDWAAIGLLYLGLLLLGSVYIAIGIFVSAMTENQVIAALVTFMLIAIVSFAGAQQAGALFDITFETQRILNFAAVDSHLHSFMAGEFDTRDISYLLMVAALFVYGSSRAIAMRRWA